MSLRISRNGTVTDSAALRAAAAADEQQIADAQAAPGHPGTGVPVEGIEHPAGGTMSPPVSGEDGTAEAAPAVAPKSPPRRPPAVPGG